MWDKHKSVVIPTGYMLFGVGLGSVAHAVGGWPDVVAGICGVVLGGAIGGLILAMKEGN